MKTTKLKFNLILTLLFVFSTLISTADERRETMEKTYKLNKTGEFTFSCYDTDLKVNTWDKDEVKLTGEIIIQGGKEDDQKKLIEIFKNPEVSSSPNSLTIETNIAKNTIVIGLIKTITLVDGKKISVDKYRVNYEIWVPESINFNLKSKYNTIDIATLTGKIDFDLYDVDLTMLSFGKDSKMKMKYSSADVGNGGDAILDIYDCEFEAKKMANVELISKYSDIEIESVETLDFNSYDDDVKIGNIKSLKTEAKYSEYRIDGNMSNCLLNFYDSDIYMKNAENLVYTAKYSTLKANDVKSVKISALFDSNIDLGKVGEFICNESKYDEIEMDIITKSLQFTGAYSLELNVGTVEPGFKEFFGDFKYGSINLPLPNDLEFSMEFETTYGDVDFPENRIKVKDFFIKESSKQAFEGATSDKPTCKIKFKGYDVNFNFD